MGALRRTWKGRRLNYKAASNRTRSEMDNLLIAMTESPDESDDVVREMSTEDLIAAYSALANPLVIMEQKWLSALTDEMKRRGVSIHS